MNQKMVDAIRARCKEDKRLAEAAHGGKWTNLGRVIESDLNESTDGSDIVADYIWDEATADFIFHCRKALPRAVEDREELLAEVECLLALVPGPDLLVSVAAYIRGAEAFHAGLRADLELEAEGSQQAFEDASALNELTQRIREAKR